MYAVFMNPLYVCMFYESPVCMHVLWIPCMYACFMNPPVCMHFLWTPLYVCMFYESPCMDACFMNPPVCMHVLRILLYAYKSEVISSNWSYVNFNFQDTQDGQMFNISYVYTRISIYIYKVVISVCLSDSKTPGPICLPFWLGNLGGSRKEWNSKNLVSR